MKILVLGSGAREHAIVLSLLAESSTTGSPNIGSSPAESLKAGSESSAEVTAPHEIIVAPGNAGIARDATATVDLDPSDPQAVANFAIREHVQLVIIGPEAPLVAGVADELREQGIPVFGPGKAAARLESSKNFAKRVMRDAAVPTGRAHRAASLIDVEKALDDFGAPYVVKADGLAAGKGVLVTDDRDAAVAHARTYLADGNVLIEEFLDGPEVSLFFVSDGHSVVPLSPAQDFKRLLNNDLGPNTGGMGAYSPLPWLNEVFGSEKSFVDEVNESVAQPVISRLATEQTPFIGLLYAGLILTSRGIRVIEFNARFGDPETQVVLPRLTTPLSALLFAAATGTLASHPRPTFSDEVAVSVVLASENYPAAPISGRAIEGLDAASAVEGVHLVHAATQQASDGSFTSTGGRVVNVVALGDTLTAARDNAYRALGEISLEGAQYRTDIAELAAASEA